MEVIEETSSDESIDDSRVALRNDLEHLVDIGPEEIAPTQHDMGDESKISDEVVEEKESGPRISEPEEGSSELENHENQQDAFDNYLKQWGAKLNA